MSSEITKHLEEAEKQLSIALALMLPYAGSGKRMPNGTLWLGSWSEVSKTAKAMLRVRSLAEKLRYLETPRKRKPGVFAARPGSVSQDLQAPELYHGAKDHDQ
ncbi:hypothetical protein [Pseudomonas koreensis]|uniref:Uncharacterized protein n=1 Tax=Pseudomonas koreensis TaxID=198620 RepID=A0AA94EP00_9PSED|nr:hypothetical protein [Pseudomonas koreensis]RVD77067.1 hypothetical protein A9HBioS_3090 [Pseudomonas koreensis]